MEGKQVILFSQWPCCAVSERTLIAIAFRKPKVYKVGDTAYMYT